MKRGYQCDGCLKFSPAEPWACPTCKKEVCEGCFSKFAHCKPCSDSFRESVLAIKATKEGWDFL